MTTKTTTAPAIAGCYPAPDTTPRTPRDIQHRIELRYAARLLTAIIDYTPGGDIQPVTDALWSVLLYTGEESITVSDLAPVPDVVSAIHSAARLVTEITDDPGFGGDDRLWLISWIMEDLRIPRICVLADSPFQPGRAPYRPH